MRIDETACRGCKMCMRACRARAIELVGSKVRINAEKCIKCGICAPFCAFQAIRED